MENIKHSRNQNRDPPEPQESLVRMGFQLSSSNDKPNPNYRATTQSNPNEQNVELNRTSLYW
ncbi:hypothetical protein S83_008616, partial [Arachis hypogaea]